MNDEAGTTKRKGVKASDLEAQLQKEPTTGGRPQSVAEALGRIDAGPTAHRDEFFAEWQRSHARRQREEEQMLLGNIRAEGERERRRFAAESATVDTATRLATVEQELKEASGMQRRALWWTRWAACVGTVAAVAAVAAVVAAAGGLL